MMKENGRSEKIRQKKEAKRIFCFDILIRKYLISDHQIVGYQLEYSLLIALKDNYDSKLLEIDVRQRKWNDWKREKENTEKKSCNHSSL